MVTAALAAIIAWKAEVAARLQRIVMDRRPPSRYRPLSGVLAC